ncbi:ABC transporter permease [Cupriavidus sp. L7L]|uniref:ABC transporter permease n=1 Tax=Cupriavidus sp. L7L TaxID=2546443 RepID=UPI00105484FA|nr:ABC transporter permease subunit [Cupriavidus sp. L7L]TDF65350.1 ABC transporter permease subunit [Cupriavidus sp. L7L]
MTTSQPAFDARLARQPAAAASEVPAQDAAPARIWPVGLLAALAWAAFGALTWRWPNHVVGFSDWAYTEELGLAALAAAALLALLALGGQHVRALQRPLAALRTAGPWLVAVPAVLSAWEILTAKTAILPTPFFAPPQALIEVYADDWRRLGDSVLNTLKLLGLGVAYGGLVGFLVGVSIGWSRRIGYWVHPVLRVLGPLPSTALLPLTFYFFPSSYSAAVFLIALATAFPVAVLTWSGVAGVNKSYYDVARTLGASGWFLVLRVAIPAALPQVFVGLFMGLGASFSVLVTAEMMGVKSGLGWYLTWAQGWASYVNMYAALIVMALLFSGVITLLFVARDRVLSWQKGTVKW